MSDRFPASITIGGTLTRPQALRLCRAIREDGACLDWGDGGFHPSSAQDLQAAARDGHLLLVNDQARYGEFPALERFCRRARIPFDRHSDPSYEYDGTLLRFRPRPTPTDSSYLASQDGEILVSAAKLQPLLALTADLPAGQRAPEIRSGCRRRLARIRRGLQTIMGADTPPLPPFSIRPR